MNDTEVNVRIAEWCGYKRLKWVDRKGRKCSAWRSPDGKDFCPPPPDYCNDLNAFQEYAISHLRNSDNLLYLEYGEELAAEVARFNSLPEQEAYHPILTCDATAAQRAAALCRVLTKTL